MKMKPLILTTTLGPLTLARSFSNPYSDLETEDDDEAFDLDHHTWTRSFSEPNSDFDTDDDTEAFYLD